MTLPFLPIRKNKIQEFLGRPINVYVDAGIFSGIVYSSDKKLIRGYYDSVHKAYVLPENLTLEIQDHLICLIDKARNSTNK